MSEVTSERLEEIQNIIKLAPNDPFPRYGLAMEYKNLGDRDSARRSFAALLESHPEYVPQYLMYGQLLVEMGDRAAAKQVLTAGIVQAEKARNQHALGELRSSLDQLTGAVVKGDLDDDEDRL